MTQFANSMHKLIKWMCLLSSSLLFSPFEGWPPHLQTHLLISDLWPYQPTSFDCPVQWMQLCLWHTVCLFSPLPVLLIFSYSDTLSNARQQYINNVIAWHCALLNRSVLFLNAYYILCTLFVYIMCGLWRIMTCNLTFAKHMMHESQRPELLLPLFILCFFLLCQC